EKRRMARQGGRLCHSGPRCGADPVRLGVLFEYRRIAALRDRAIACGAGLPSEMHRDLLISAGPGEWRAVVAAGGVPVALRIERGNGAEAGSLYLGRVVRLLPALGAAEVDIGGIRPAFLPQSEMFRHRRRLTEGERVVVEIRREAQAGKAARLAITA